MSKLDGVLVLAVVVIFLLTRAYSEDLPIRTRHFEIPIVEPLPPQQYPRSATITDMYAIDDLGRYCYANERPNEIQFKCMALEDGRVYCVDLSGNLFRLRGASFRATIDNRW